MKTTSSNPKCIACGYPMVQIGRNNPDGSATFRCNVHGAPWLQAKHLVREQHPNAVCERALEPGHLWVVWSGARTELNVRALGDLAESYPAAWEGAASKLASR